MFHVPIATGLGRSARFVVAMAAVLAAVVLSTTLLTAPSLAQPTGDLPASAFSDFGCGKKMQSDATYLRAQNRIVGHTALYNDCQLAGFHGAVVAVLSDANERVVGFGDPHRYGVDGKGPCWPVVVSWWPLRTEWRCPPTLERHVFWEDAANLSAAATATKLTLIQYPAPNSWLESLQALRLHLDEAVAVGKSVGEIIAIIGAMA
jgi:hypothetical protein